MTSGHAPRGVSLSPRHLFAMFVVLLLTGCASLPPDVERTPSDALFVSEQTALGSLALDAAGPHPGKSGFTLLDAGRAAFLQRAALIEAAERSIDAQYYIWNSDVSGRYLARRLLLAADRGVRVRLLLDDFNTAGRDLVFAALASHPRIEVRIYNPFATREGVGKVLELMEDFDRVNRRMHNKTFVVDGAFGIVGGRNIGDEYFGLHPEVNFLDRDMLAAGPVVREISENFDRYWNSDAAYPAEALLVSKARAQDNRALMEAARAAAGDIRGLDCEPVQQADAALETVERWLPGFEWAPAELVYSDPVTEESMADDDRPSRPATRLGELVESSRESVLMESAYFILEDHHLQHLRELIGKGVSVRAITNSLASNDLVPNHAGYARSRPGMLDSGMRLYELRPDAQICARCAAACDGDVSLHAKTMVIDREVLYVGSFNLNLRSIYLNGETVLIVHSPRLAEAVADSIEGSMQPGNAWAVSESQDGGLRWTGSDGVYDHEPETGFWQRVESALYSLLPIEKYL